MSLRIREIYGYASLQGLPTNGLRAFGVPPGGAFDQESFLLANALVGNPRDALAIEFTLAAAKIEIIQPSMIGMVGAECEVFIDGRSAQAQSVYHLLPGQILDIGAPTKGCRLYMAVHGITTKKKFDEQLVKGNVIEAKPHIGPPGKVRSLSKAPSSLESHSIRVIVDEPLPSTPLTVSIKSNRVGVRLDGAQMQAGEERLSESSCPGALQVTNDGALVIHGPDGPTIGGYKKIGAVCSADPDRVGQLRPGDEVTLQTITRQRAVTAWQLRKNRLEEKVRELILQP